MKKQTLCTALALVTALLFAGPIRAQAAESSESQDKTEDSVIAGYLDRVEDGVIVGWGWDSSTPNTAIPVSVTVTKEESGEVIHDFEQTAAVYREDLVAEGIGNGRHGFRITVNWEAMEEGTYLIQGSTDSQAFDNTLTYTVGEAAENTAAAEAANQQADSGLISLGYFRTTGYCPCRLCSEGYGRATCTGALATANHTIAVDPKVIPFGSRIMIDGIIYTAEDRGGGVKGNHIDIYFDTHSQTRQHGNQMQEVFLLKS
ncbi:MAG: 3D domain-containing protein [Clostridiales bacterium]|nr:3D domain-containing protein [Clostridiales bacterium]